MHTIDAQGKKLGRLASEVALLLMGKNSASFKRNIVLPVSVRVTNASKLSISSQKMKTKEYRRYSGYPGGLKAETLEALSKRRGFGEALRRAIYGMLPKNKLRAIRIKNLIIEE